MKGIFFLFLCCSLIVQAQTTDLRGRLPKVPQNGFYKIPLPPELVSKLNAGFTNLRIYDSLQREAPYLMQSEVPWMASEKFSEYPIREKASKDRFTQIVFDNQEKRPINNVTLVIKNAETTKRASLLGSDDGITWYALKEDFYLSTIQGIHQTYEMRILDFPLSNYAQFKLRISDSTSAPLNILKIGYYETDLTTGNYTALPSPSFTMKEDRSQKKSVVRISFDGPALLDKLEVEIAGPSFYNRSAVLQHPVPLKTRKGKTEIRNEYLKSLQLISTQQSSFNLSSVVVNELLLEIDNQDNVPLQIKGIKVFQLNRYLIAWLSKDQAYELRVGNADMQAPSYDIAYFKDSIPANAPVLKPNPLSNQQEKPATESTSWLSDKRIIWAAILLVSAILGLMSYRMVKDMKNPS
jgi:hypothetical protein